MSVFGRGELGSSEPQPPILIYDGDCAFCSSTIRTLQRIMKKKSPMVPFQHVDTSRFGLTKQQCSQEIKFVDASGRVHGGEGAFRNLFIHAEGLWAFLGRLMNLPGVRTISGTLYRWVARNRYRLPGGTPTCALPRKVEDQ